LAERCIHDRTCFLVSVRPLAYAGVQGDGRRGVAQGELDPLDACALMNEPGSEVVAETVQAHAFGNPAAFAAGTQVLRVPKTFRITMGDGTVLTCEGAVKKLLRGKRCWEVRSAGKGSKGDRWYAWAWIGTVSSGHSLLIRRDLKSAIARHTVLACAGPRDLRRRRSAA
jgi:hypothetical protein